MIKLKPKYDGAKSFYNKARVREDNWDMNKQVIVKSDSYVKKMSLNTFKNTVKPVKIDCKFISVSE